MPLIIMLIYDDINDDDDEDGDHDLESCNIIIAKRKQSEPK